MLIMLNQSIKNLKIRVVIMNINLKKLKFNYSVNRVIVFISDGLRICDGT